MNALVGVIGLGFQGNTFHKNKTQSMFKVSIKIRIEIGTNQEEIENVE
jgi:hypothetical protein